MYSINGQLLGSVDQDWSICAPKFSVKDAAGETVLKIDGPICTFSCGSDVVFHVKTLDKETKVGKITKQWSGLAREMFTDADFFGVTFPMDLDVQIKAVLMATTFLIVSSSFRFFKTFFNLIFRYRILCSLKTKITITTIIAIIEIDF